MNSNNTDNNQNNNTEKSKVGVILGIAFLAVVIGFAMLFYNRNSDFKTENEENTIKEMTEAKEKAEKYKEQQINNDVSYENETGTSEENVGAPENTENTAEEPIPAPDFTVYNSDGTAVRFSDKIGKPMIINFWATWCGPCKSEMPYFEKAYKEHGDKIEFMMINPTDGVNDTNEAVDKFINQYGYTFPVYRDTDIDASSIYGIRAFPTTILVDKDGYILGGYEGAMTEEMLNSLIELLLS